MEIAIAFLLIEKIAGLVESGNRRVEKLVAEESRLSRELLREESTLTRNVIKEVTEKMGERAAARDNKP